MLGIGLIAVFGTRNATAAALGTLAGSTGLLATLLAVFAMKGWSAVASAETASTAGGALLVAAAAAWLVPSRSRLRARVRKNRRSLVAAVPCAVALSARGIDADDLRTELVTLFHRVQRAWDQTELAALGDSTTSEMLEELMRERSHCLALPGSARTQIVAVEVELLGYEELPGAAVVTVAFSGSLRDDADRPVLPFRELWLLTRSPAAGGRWRLARHQALY